jgi:sugar/nucleoside kinase (ribokinase family)
MSSKMPRIAFIGDLTADVYVDSDEVKHGGAALNMAIWGKREGMTSIIASAVGTDAIGNTFLQFIRTQKLSTLSVQKKRGTTSSIEIFLKDGERHYGKWKPGVLTSYHLRPQDKKRLAKTDAIIVTIYPKYEHVLRELSQWKQTIPVDKRPVFVINYGDLKEFENNLEVVRQYLELVDILVFGLNKDEDEKLINEIRDLSSTHRMCVVTLGKFGSLAWANGSSFVMPSKVVRIEDTTGAGDAFLVGFMKSYLSTRDVSASLKAGSALAVKVIGKIGAY